MSNLVTEIVESSIDPCKNYFAFLSKEKIGNFIINFKRQILQQLLHKPSFI